MDSPALGHRLVTQKTSRNIAIIGGGVIGLTTGILLRRLGYGVTIYASDLPPRTNSDRACAIWLPIFVGDPERLTDDYVVSSRKWAQYSWHIFETLLGSEYGIYWTTNYEMFPEPCPDPYFADIVYDFNSGGDTSLPAGLTYKWVFRTLIVETPKYMTALLREYERAGGQIEIRHFASIEEVMALSQPVVFNLSALGARSLFGDEDIRPVKGQLLLHEPRDLGYSLGCGEYAVIPRSDALILGTLFEENFDSPLPTDDCTDRIWKMITSWLSPTDGLFDLRRLCLEREKIDKIVTGLRPYRSGGIRLEAELIGNKLIIHDYGHGGGGFTFSWGCAHDWSNCCRR